MMQRILYELLQWPCMSCYNVGIILTCVLSLLYFAKISYVCLKSFIKFIFHVHVWAHITCHTYGGHLVLSFLPCEYWGWDRVGLPLESYFTTNKSSSNLCKSMHYKLTYILYKLHSQQYTVLTYLLACIKHNFKNPFIGSPQSPTPLSLDPIKRDLGLQLKALENFYPCAINVNHCNASVFNLSHC